MRKFEKVKITQHVKADTATIIFHKILNQQAARENEFVMLLNPQPFQKISHEMFQAAKNNDWFQQWLLDSQTFIRQISLFFFQARFARP